MASFDPAVDAASSSFRQRARIAAGQNRPAPARSLASAPALIRQFGLGQEHELIREETGEHPRDPDQATVQECVQSAAGCDVKSQIDRDYGTSLLRDPVTVVAQKPASRLPGEEAHMGPVEDAPLGVLETPEQELKPDDDICHIGHRNQNSSTRLEKPVAFLEDPLRASQVFENVQEQDPIERLRSQPDRDWRKPSVQIALHVLLKNVPAFRHGKLIDSGYAILTPGELRGEGTMTAAHVQNVVPRSSHAERAVVAGARSKLQRVMRKILRKFRMPGNRTARLEVMLHRAHDVSRISESVHVTDFSTVVGRDRNLTDRVTLVMEFDDDLGVEMEVVAHP